MKSAEANPVRDGASLTWLGLIGVTFYVIHAVHELVAGRPESLLWACHLATLAVGAGLLSRCGTCIGIGVMWLALGLPMWALEVATRGGFEPTAALTHVGGLILGLFGLYRLGLTSSIWWKAVAALAVLHFVSRWITPQEANINLAFAIWPGWERYFPSHGVYILAIAILCLLLFGGVEVLLRRTGFGAPRR